MSKDESEEINEKVKDGEIPSNIVWESRRWDSGEDICNRILTFIGLTILMLVVWGIIALTRYQT
jgi:hypothetical protein